MMDGLGFARALDFEPFIALAGHHPDDLARPDRSSSPAASMSSSTRSAVDSSVDLTDRDIEVAFGTVPAGTVGAVRTIASGIVDGREAIVVDHVIRMARDVAPDWPTSDNDATYIVNIEGDPDIECRLTLGPPEGHDAGEAAMTATAMRIVNAVPFVVDAAAGPAQLARPAGDRPDRTPST